MLAKLLISLLSITSATVASASANEGSSSLPRPVCELFLAPGFVNTAAFLPAENLIFALGQGLNLRTEDLNILSSAAEVNDYLVEHPTSPWTADLKSLNREIFQGHKSVVYVSPLGVSVWPRSEFDNWIQVQSRDWNNSLVVHETISYLARGYPLPGLSEAAVERVRNSYLAAAEGDKTRREIEYRYEQYLHSLYRTQVQDPTLHTPLTARNHVLQHLLNPPPDIGLPPNVDLSQMDEETRNHLIRSIFDVEKESKSAQIEFEMRNQAPSLNLRFVADLTNPQGEPIALRSVSHREDALWLGRILVRENLIRHLVPGVQGPIPEETIFMVAAFPELLPYWPLLSRWPQSIRHLPLRLDYGFYPLELGPINSAGDTVFLDLSHAIIPQRKGAKEITRIKIQFGPRKAALPFQPDLFVTDVDRIRKQLVVDWKRFRSLSPRSATEPPDLTMDDMVHFLTLHSNNGVSEAEILAFFFFLAQSYPQR